jgi:hypothetical protein
LASRLRAKATRSSTRGSSVEDLVGRLEVLVLDRVVELRAVAREARHVACVKNSLSESSDSK